MTMQTRLCCPSSRLAAPFMAILLLLGEPLTAGEISPQRNTRIVKAIRNAEPAVVNIEGNKPAATVSGSPSDQQLVNGMGAGVIIDPRGYILTNQHVIQDVARIEVTLSNGRQYVGKLIARHPETDLAMIKIDSRKPLPVIRCGISSDLLLGEPVIAIGNPFGYHHTVTQGIISALHRDIPVNGVQNYPDLIQTDASINPGNSGGPLLNADGDMIGLNAAVRIGAQGIGFAIPIDRALEVAADMIAKYRRSSGRNDIQVKTEYEDCQSLLRVVHAKAASFEQGDVITKVNGQTIKNRLHYELALVGERNGSRVPIEVEREGVSQSIDYVLNGSNSDSRVQFVSSGGLPSKVLSELGLRLEPANSATVRRIDSSYKGGLTVRSVQKNSPADRAQIQAGDILVGLMEWQTPDWNDLEWVMNSKEMQQSASPKFHIIRGNEVFWGNLEIR